MTVTRRALLVLKWLGIVVLALLVLALVAGAVYEQYARREAAGRFPPRGQMVDIGGRKIHLDCRGAGSPTVILESGLDVAGTLSWYKVLDAIAKTTRTCSYDRAGIMWSDAPPHAQDGDHVARDLHDVLAAAKIDGPLVLVGHSLGGPYIMNYTRQFGANVKGLVFVDASHPDQFEKMVLPGKEKEVPQPPFVMRALAAMSWTGLPRFMDSPPIPGEPKQIGEARKADLGHSMNGALAELAALGTSLRQGGQLRSLGNRPIVVLTAMKPYDAAVLEAQKLTAAQGAARQLMWESLQDDEARWSTRSRHESVLDASHYIQLDRPDVVIRAVEEVVATVRADP